MTTAIEASLLELVVRLREEIESVEDGKNKFGKFKAGLKSNELTITAPRASELWKAAGQAIQKKKSAAAMAAPAQSPSAANLDGQGAGEPPTEEEEEVDPQDEEEDDVPEGANPPPAQEEEEF